MQVEDKLEGAADSIYGNETYQQPINVTNASRKICVVNISSWNWKHQHSSTAVTHPCKYRGICSSSDVGTWLLAIWWSICPNAAYHLYVSIWPNLSNQTTRWLGLVSKWPSNFRHIGHQLMSNIGQILDKCWKFERSANKALAVKYLL